MSHRCSLALSVAVLAAASSTILAPTTASAQVRAALVRNVDEPGRVPFAQDVVGTCNAVNCFFTFATVPAGKRLVIEQIEGLARSLSTTAVFSDAELVTSSSVTATSGVRHNFHMSLLSPAGSSNVFNGWYFNSPTKAYVEAGSSPSVTMHQSTAGGTAFSQVTITGYLVDTTP